MRVKASLLALGLVLGACGMQVSAASTENEIVSVESIQPRAEQQHLLSHGEILLKLFNAQSIIIGEILFKREKCILLMNVGLVGIAKQRQECKRELIVHTN